MILRTMHSILLTVILASCQRASSLKLREVSVPAVVMRGDPVRLNCSYDLEGDKLYSVKWHKDNVEFYRFLPEDRPEGQKYELEGIYLDLENCKEGFIYMHRTDVKSEGIYRCEVSTDAPSFQTVKGEGEMRIYVFPSEHPAILGNTANYGIGDEVNVTCLAAPSRPAAFLKWFMNGKEAPGKYLTRSPPLETADGLLISSLGLKFVLQRQHFSGKGTMSLHCEAIISQAHTLTSGEILISYNATGSKSARVFSSSSFRSPSITGGRIRYKVGDLMDVNCTAWKSQPPAELHWYINDKEVRPEHLVSYPPVVHEDGLESSVLGLRIIVKQRHFQKGQMRLRCTAAALSEVIRMSSPMVEVVNNRQQQSGLHVFETPRAGASITDEAWCSPKFRSGTVYFALNGRMTFRATCCQNELSNRSSRWRCHEDSRWGLWVFLSYVLLFEFTK